MTNSNFYISDNTSVSLDIVRVIASQMVVIGHGISFMSIAKWLQPPNFPYIQNIAVVIFFILSGFFISNSLFKKTKNSNYNFKIYYVERFSRIYSGYIPAIVIIIVLDIIWLNILSGNDINNAFNMNTLIGNLFMLQDSYRVVEPLIGRSFFGVTSFGSARIFWNLAAEWWMYMFFGWLILGNRSF